MAASAIATNCDTRGINTLDVPIFSSPPKTHQKKEKPIALRTALAEILMEGCIYVRDMGYHGTAFISPRLERP